MSPAEPAPTPVSGALEGNPPPEAPPAVPEPAAPEPAAPAEPTDAEQSAPSGLPGADDAESPARAESAQTSGDNGGEQPTQAFSSLGGPGGDPLAQREHREQ